MNKVPQSLFQARPAFRAFAVLPVLIGLVALAIHVSQFEAGSWGSWFFVAVELLMIVEFAFVAARGQGFFLQRLQRYSLNRQLARLEALGTVQGLGERGLHQ